MEDSGHTTHELGWALRTGTQQKKRMFTKCQHHAERHELHKGDPGPQSQGDQAMGQRRERQVSQMKARCPGAEGTQTAARTGHSGAGTVLGRKRGLIRRQAGTRGHSWDTLHVLSEDQQL